MFNELRKEEFINLYANDDNAVRTLYSLFNKTQRHECILDKDVSCFTIDEIKDLLLSLESKSEQSVQVTLSRLRVYTNWMIKNNLTIDGINHYSELNSQDLNQFVIKEYNNFIDENLLEQIISEVINVSDEVIIRSIYEGMASIDKKQIELTELRRQDIDFEKGVIHLCTNRTFYPSYALLEAMKKSLQEEFYLTYIDYQKEQHINNKIVSKDYVIGKTYRETGQTSSNTSKITKRLYRIRTGLGYTNLTISKLRNSGFINNVLKLMRQNNYTTIKEIYDTKEFEEILDRYDLTKQPDYYFGQLFKRNLGKNWQKEYLNEY